jgi:hypothetical protein
MMFVRALAMVVVMASATMVPTAHAADEVAINGTFTAFSDGQWAQTNLSYHDEASVTQRWVISSTCATFQDCTGTVTSDQGWTGDLKYSSGLWRARHTVDNWEQCIDGTGNPGEQTFTFWPRNPPDGTYAGMDQTIGPSGACGYNRWLNIRMPLTLTPVP